jgi:hypothetical protein
MAQRQIKLEPVNDTTLQLKAPNLPAFELALNPAEGRPGYRLAMYELPLAGGDKVLRAETPAGGADLPGAWQWAFEYFRQHVII